MSKTHIGPNGPGPCGAGQGRCPYGGASGLENHFDTMQDAEAAYAVQMAAEGYGATRSEATAAPGLAVARDYSEIYASEDVCDYDDGRPSYFSPRRTGSIVDHNNPVSGDKAREEVLSSLGTNEEALYEKYGDTPHEDSYMNRQYYSFEDAVEMNEGEEDPEGDAIFTGIFAEQEYRMTLAITAAKEWREKSGSQDADHAVIVFTRMHHGFWAKYKSRDAEELRAETDGAWTYLRNGLEIEREEESLRDAARASELEQNKIYESQFDQPINPSQMFSGVKDFFSTFRRGR